MIKLKEYKIIVRMKNDKYTMVEKYKQIDNRQIKQCKIIKI